MYFKVFLGAFLVFSLASLVRSKCSSKQASELRKCTQASEFTHIFINLERRGLGSILLTNLSQSVFNLHCSLFSDYSTCVSRVNEECKTPFMKDPLYEGIQDYYSYLCSRQKSYQDYTKAIECKVKAGQLDAVKTCDNRVSHISLHPTPNSGVCSDLSSWMRCYTQAVSTTCVSSPSDGVYVLTSQWKLIQKLAAAAECKGQDFQYQSKDTKSPSSSHGHGSASSWWVVAVVLAMLVIVGVIGVLIFVVYRRRYSGVPRQRLINEVA